MKWNKKFTYPSSTRAITNGKRYYDINNEKLPSVTSILAATEPPEKKASLERWRKKLGVDVANKITTEAAARGSKMHAFLEKFLLGKLNLDLLGEKTRESMMADQIIENGLRDKLNSIWGCEAALYYPNKFAGAADLIAEDYEGSSAIIDFKQSNSLKKDQWIDSYYLQCAAYSLAHNKVYGTDINKAVILICTKDDLFQRFIVDGDRFKNYQDQFLKRVDQFYAQI
jgi:RecB family exonuclease|tara:strand:- start:1737 stop:2417 length:681 start_codon:yes stop_codon:yes gene_type:complete